MRQEHRVESDACSVQLFNPVDMIVVKMADRKNVMWAMSFCKCADQHSAMLRVSSSTIDHHA
ncbi:hypothetical protein CVE36_09665 [Pseudomonas syringae pv. actinidiae]|nr:hypothetical protein [Pseudomonas syringae pv. actinidiae]